MRCWTIFAFGAALYLIGFLGYVMFKFDANSYLIMAVPGVFLMLGTLMRTFILQLDSKPSNQPATYYHMMRCFCLIACMVIIHALAENAMDWHFSDTENPTPSNPENKQSNLW